MSVQSSDVIFVIGNNSGIQELLENAGMKTALFSSLNSAIVASSNGMRPSLIILNKDEKDADNGLTRLTSDLSTAPYMKNIPTILLTSPDDQNQFENIPFNTYLISPINKTGLLDTTQKLLKSRSDTDIMSITNGIADSMFRTLFDVIPDIAIIHDGNGIVTAVNRQGISALNSHTSDISGRNIFEILHIHNTKEYNRVLYKARTSGPQTFTTKISIDNIKYTTVELVLSVLEVQNGPVYISIIRDTASHDINNNFSITIKKMRNICEEAGVTCHSFNQPLQAILGNSDLMLIDVDQNDSRYMILNEIREQSKKMAILSKQLNQIIRQDLMDTIKSIDLNE